MASLDNRFVSSENLIAYFERDMKNKSHPKVTFRWSSVDQVLLPALSGVAKTMFWRCKGKCFLLYLQTFWLFSLLNKDKLLTLQSKMPILAMMHIVMCGAEGGRHYIMEKRHTMLCRLVIWNYHKRLLTKDNAKLMPRVCWLCIPVVCLKANHAFTAHFRVYQQYDAWVSLCSSVSKAVVGLRWQTSRRRIPTFFV